MFMLVVPISTCIAVVVAYLLNQKLRFSALFQTAYFLPMVTSITAVGLGVEADVQQELWHHQLPAVFHSAWITIPWLENAAWSIPALVIFGVWNILPFTIILLLSGLQNIDPQYYTAARVDGSKGLRIFLRITVPLLAPTIFLVCIVNTISCFKVFSRAVSVVQRQTRSVQQLVYSCLLHPLCDDGKPQVWYCRGGCAGSVPVYLCVYHGAAVAAKEERRRR